jgi:hypothetical protein
MNIAYLTIEQKDQLIGQQYANDSYFNPILDANDKWVISEEEINFLANHDFLWLNDLPISMYNPKPQTQII